MKVKYMQNYCTPAEVYDHLKTFIAVGGGDLAEAKSISKTDFLVTTGLSFRFIR